MKIALSIAGSDSGAGAGIQADLKTFSVLGVYGCTAITAITAQNTMKVAEIFEVSPTAVEEQIDSVLTDMPPDAIKVGMVYSKMIIDAVFRSIEKTKVPVVLDPIFAAGTGVRLLRDDALDLFISELMPIATLVTPNRMEAEKIAGIRIRTESDGFEAAEKIAKLGAKNVIIKGGHFSASSVTDLLLDAKGSFTKITNPRINTKEIHGSGCNFSSAVTAYLAKRFVLEDACRMASDYVHWAIKNAIKLGAGLLVANPLSAMFRDADRFYVIEELRASVEEISSLHEFYRLIPETHTNFVYALPDAKDTSEVAGVRGRIAKIGNTAAPVSCVDFGASRHMAAAVVAYMGINRARRSVINIKFDERLLRICKSLFSVSSYDRKREPESIKKKEGSSVSWGTIKALSKNPKADVIYHRGDIGKEPMITVFGRNPSEVVSKIKEILENY